MSNKQNIIINKKCLANEIDRKADKKTGIISVSNLKNDIKQTKIKKVLDKKQKDLPKIIVNDIIEDDSISKISSVMTSSPGHNEYADSCSNDDNNDNNDDDSNGTNITNEINATNAPDIRDVLFSPKEKYYFKTVDKFYRKDGNKFIKIMVDIIEGKSHVSLRLIEWFITRYAYKKKISYSLKNDSDLYKFKFPVHISYKSQLKAYKKRYFDPFRRKKKFMYSYYVGDDKKKLFTTIGQLNFFLWAFDNNVIDYIFKHYDEINKAMIKSNKDDKKNKNKPEQQECKSHKPIEYKEIVNKKSEKINLCTTLEFD